MFKDFFSSLFYSDLIGKKLSQFSQVETVLPTTIIGDWSLPFFVLTHIFPHPIQLRSENDRGPGGHPGSSQGRPMAMS